MKLTDKMIDEIENDSSWEEDSELGHDENHTKFHFSLPICEMGIVKKEDENSYVKGYD